MEKVEIPTIYFTHPKYEKAAIDDFNYWTCYSKCAKSTVMSTASTTKQNNTCLEKDKSWVSKHRTRECDTVTDHNKNQTVLKVNRKQKSNVRLKSDPKWQQLFPLIILTVLSLFCQMSEECPTVCECKWKSGKESVVCANSKTKLTAIPTGLDPGTQLLDLSKNNVQLLQAKVFHNLNLLNLQKIFLPDCGLKTLEKNVFFKLNNLVELDLSRNRIDSIPTHTFDQIPELRELKLNSNPISKVATNAFAPLTRLVRLELSRCRIGTVDSAAFRGLVSLEWLKLDNNRLLTVQVVSFYPLRNLHGIWIHENPWNCSCMLQPLRDWMSKNNVPYGVPPVCSEPPRLSGKSWDQLQREDFACLPKVQNSVLAATGELTTATEGQNATLVCKLQATADTQVRWMNGNKPVVLSSSRYSLSESFTQSSIDGEKILTQTSTTTTTFSGGKLTLGIKTSKLTVIRTKLRDSGVYSCRAETRAGAVSANFSLQVLQTSVENHSAQFLLYGASIAIVTLSLCILLLCFVFYCGKQKSRILTEEKVELNHVGQNGRLPQNGHGPHTRNGGTAIPLLHNHMNNLNSQQNTPNHRPKNGSSLINSLNLGKRSGSVITNSKTANNHSANGLLNKRYKALPTSDMAADEVDADEPNFSSDVEENDENDESDNVERKFSRVGVHKKCSTTVFQVVNKNQRISSTLEQKFPDLINSEESPSHSVVNKKCENNERVRSAAPSVRTALLPTPATSSPSTSNSINTTNASYYDHNTSTSTTQPLLNLHRRSNSESESHSLYLRPKLVPNGNSPKIGTCPSTSAQSIDSNSANSNFSTESPYGSTTTYQTVLSTPPTYTKFTFTQRPTPPTPNRKRTFSFSNTISHNNQNPNQIYYYRQLSQQNNVRANNPFQRRSMPTSPVHYANSPTQQNSLYFHKTNTIKFHGHGQGSDPGLTNQDLISHSQEYDYHAVQLAAFLEEYRQLQMELMRMSASLTEMDPVTNINDHNSTHTPSDPLAVRVTSNNSNLNFGLNSAEQFQQQQHIKSILKSSGTNNNYLV